MSYATSLSRHDAAFSNLTTTPCDSIENLFPGTVMFLLTLRQMYDTSNVESLGIAHVVVLPSTRSELEVPFGTVALTD